MKFFIILEWQSSTPQLLFREELPKFDDVASRAKHYGSKRATVFRLEGNAYPFATEVYKWEDIHACS